MVYDSLVVIMPEIQISDLRPIPRWEWHDLLLNVWYRESSV